MFNFFLLFTPFLLPWLLIFISSHIRIQKNLHFEPMQPAMQMRLKQTIHTTLAASNRTHRLGTRASSAGVSSVSISSASSKRQQLFASLCTGNHADAQTHALLALRAPRANPQILHRCHTPHSLSMPIRNAGFSFIIPLHLWAPTFLHPLRLPLYLIVIQEERFRKPFCRCGNGHTNSASQVISLGKRISRRARANSGARSRSDGTSQEGEMAAAISTSQAPRRMWCRCCESMCPMVVVSLLSWATLCTASMSAPHTHLPSSFGAPHFNLPLPKCGFGMVDDAVSIGSRLVQLARGRAPIRGGGDGAERRAGAYNSFSTFPAGQPVIDDENDGELLASFVYEGIRPTISEDSQAASRGSLSHSPNAVAALEKRQPMEPEAQRLLHHKLMMEATKAGKLKHHGSQPIIHQQAPPLASAHLGNRDNINPAVAAARAAMPSQAGVRAREDISRRSSDAGAEGQGAMGVGEEGNERRGAGTGGREAVTETRTLISFEVVVPDAEENTRVKVVGGHHLLGDWQPDRAPSLQPVASEPGTFFGEMWVDGAEDGGEPIRIEYKYVLEVSTGGHDGHAAVGFFFVVCV